MPMLESAERYFWSDSTAVLHSIYNNKKRFPVFFANRLAKIGQWTDIKGCRHVPTKENPADKVSRGVPADLLVTQSEWLSGAPFLWKPSDKWPEQPKKLTTLPRDFAMFEKQTESNVVLTSSLTKKKPTDQFIDYFSSFYRLKRAATWSLKFFENLRCKKSTHNDGKTVSTKMSVEDLKLAEKRLIMYVRARHFAPLISVLEHERPLTNAVCSRPLQKLTPFVHEGVMMRVGGRLSKAPIEFEARHPAN